MANIFRYGKEGGQNESISRSTTVPELRYDEIQVGDQASLTKQLQMKMLSILQN